MALTDNLLAYWSLDDSSWNDSSGNNHTLIDYDGGNPVTVSNGIVNSGALVDTGKYLICSSINVGSSYTISVWVKPIDFYIGYDCIWSFDDPNSPTGVVGQGQTYFFVGNKGSGDYNLLPPAPQADTGSWSHLCYVIDNINHTQKFYVNGILHNTGVDSGDWGNWSGFILGAYPGRGLSSHSHLDEVGIWNRALTFNEVYNLYYKGVGNTYPFSKPVITPQLNEDVLAYWKMDESSGNRIDSTGNLYDLVQYPLAPVGGTFNGLWKVNIDGYDMVWNSELTAYVGDGITYQLVPNFDQHAWSLVYNNGIGDYTEFYYNDSVDFRNGNWYDNTNEVFVATYYYNTVNYDANGVINDAVLIVPTNSAWLSYYNYAEDLQIPIDKSNFSVSCWFKAQDTFDQRTIAAQWYDDIGYSWLIYFNGDGNIVIVVNNNDGFHFLPPNLHFDTNTWYHLVFTYDGNDVKLYINSQLVGIMAVGGALINTLTPIEIGTHAGSTDNIFNGSIDEVGIWNRVLSQENIFNLYYRRDGNSYPFSKPVITQNLNDELLAYYPLDENTGTRYDFANGYDLQEKVNFVKTVIVFDAPGGEPTLASSHGTYTRTSGELTPFNGPNGNTLTYSEQYGRWILFDATANTITYQIDDDGPDVNFYNWSASGASGDLASTTESVYYVVGSEQGIIDNAASFVGTPSNYLYNDSIHTDLPLFSVSFWVNARSFNGGSYPTAVTIGNEAQDGSDTLWFTNEHSNRLGSYVYLFDSYNNVVGNVQPNLTFGTWQHCVITSDAFSVNYYKDGNLVESTPLSDLTSKPLTFAGFKLGGSSFLNSTFDGLLDDVKIWNRAITPNEITSIYKSGLPKTNKYNFQKVLGIPTYTFEKVTPQSILNFPFYIKSGSGGAGKLTIPLYQDGLYGKRYNGYYPDNGGVTAFQTLPRSTDNYSPHGDEEATVDFYNFSSSPNGSLYDNYSWQWTGYFKAPYTDDFVFRIANVDDSVDLWVGDNAISGFTSENRIVGGLYNADNTSDPIHMIGGQYYPVRLQFGEANGADQFILEYSSSYETNVSNFQGRFFHLTDQDLII
jgi:hypothetical protein